MNTIDFRFTGFGKFGYQFGQAYFAIRTIEK